MYLNLALSLADDLALGQRQGNLPSLRADSIDPEALYAYDGFSKAAKRAYLGCYYLSSA